jgi:NAD-dependent epimerase/dehydratase family protein
MDSNSIVVTGGGGFIGGHLVGRLLDEGRPVRSIDHKPLDDWYQVHSEAENMCLDLRLADACSEALRGASEVYNFAADMGGMGFIESNKALCMLSVLINTHLLQASVAAGVERFFFSSSACVYAEEKQSSANVTALQESDAYPAMPRTATAGKSSSANACAVTFGRTSASTPMSPVTDIVSRRLERLTDRWLSDATSSRLSYDRQFVTGRGHLEVSSLHWSGAAVAGFRGATGGICRRGGAWRCLGRDLAHSRW